MVWTMCKGTIKILPFPQPYPVVHLSAEASWALMTAAEDIICSSLPSLYDIIFLLVSLAEPTELQVILLSLHTISSVSYNE